MSSNSAIIQHVPHTLKQYVLIALFILFPIAVSISFDVAYGCISILFLFILELMMYFLVKINRRRFPWLITSADALPFIDRDDLDKFITFGFDPELGWVRKPNTEKAEIGKNGLWTRFHIGANGSRVNPGHDGLAGDRIALYGDSFAFGRQVNDNESLQWHLSEMLHVNVLNFAVGNYGFDQALLRFKRLQNQFPTRITVFGLVPSTIVRIHDMWKHYNEFGNVYGFKPRFMLGRDGSLNFLPNEVADREALLNYRLFLSRIQKSDVFYKRKFLKEMLRFPYLFHVFAQPRRNLPLLYFITREQIKKHQQESRNRPYPSPMQTIMRINLALRRSMFSEDVSVSLLKALTMLMLQECAGKGCLPLLLWMPQKDDILHIKQTGDFFYRNYTDWVGEKMPIIDMTNMLLETQDIDALYCDDTAYGGHFSNRGNQVVADITAKFILENSSLNEALRCKPCSIGIPQIV